MGAREARVRGERKGLAGSEAPGLTALLDECEGKLPFPWIWPRPCSDRPPARRDRALTLWGWPLR